MIKQIVLIISVFLMAACGGRSGNVNGEVSQTVDTIPEEQPLVFGELQNQKQCFIVISKPESITPISVMIILT